MPDIARTKTITRFTSLSWNKNKATESGTTTASARISNAPSELRKVGALKPIIIMQHFITNSDVVAHGYAFDTCHAQRIVHNGEIMGIATCDTRGSPFQLPTRLADGLGPGSDLEIWLPSFVRPILTSSEDFGSPASARRKAGRLRLQLLQSRYLIACSLLFVKLHR